MKMHNLLLIKVLFETKDYKLCIASDKVQTLFKSIMYLSFTKLSKRRN